jgi:uncharacterized protein (TIGR03000 family)
MYSVVMATMLAAGTTTPAWHHHHSYGYGYGCHSCYSSYCSRCYCSSYGGYGCCGGCYSYGCYGGGYGCCGGCYSYGCYCSGCYGCSVAYSYGCCSAPVCCTAAGPRVVPVPSKQSEPVPSPKKTSDEGSVIAQQRSRVTIAAPSNARVWVDNVECPVRSFETPALNANQQYVYNFRMETIRDGQAVVQTQRAIITPGQPVNVDFNQGGVATAASR